MAQTLAPMWVCWRTRELDEALELSARSQEGTKLQKRVNRLQEWINLRGSRTYEFNQHTRLKFWFHSEMHDNSCIL